MVSLESLQPGKTSIPAGPENVAGHVQLYPLLDYSVGHQKFGLSITVSLNFSKLIPHRQGSEVI